MSLQYKLPEIKTTGTSLRQTEPPSFFNCEKFFSWTTISPPLKKNTHVDILKFLVLKKVVFNVLSIQMYSIRVYTLILFFLAI